VTRDNSKILAKIGISTLVVENAVSTTLLEAREKRFHRTLQALPFSLTGSFSAASTGSRSGSMMLLHLFVRIFV
jgi:hypothetical protein